MNWAYNNIIEPLSGALVDVGRVLLQPVADLLKISIDNLIALMVIVWFVVFSIAVFISNPVLVLVLVGLIAISKK